MGILLQGGPYTLIRRVLAATLAAILLFYILCVVLFVCNGLIQEIPHVNIEEYIENIDYGILSERQIKTFNDILSAVENAESVVSCPTYSYKERHEILTHLGLYFGTMEKIETLTVWSNSKIYLNLKMFNEFENNKVIIDARIDEAVSTIKEGSDRYKLWQISNYISAKMVYTDGYRETISALNGKGVCSSYTMLFYKMATRLGIKTYICYGYVNDMYHAWNMVELNGEYRHYDVTWYDDSALNIKHIKYLYSQSSWDRMFEINNLWAADLDWLKNKNSRGSKYVQSRN